jgi:hypothetical protein
MDLTGLKPWLVFLHVLGVLLFLVAHGASAALAFRVRSERDPARLRALLDLSASTIPALYGSLLLMLVAGIVAGFIAPNWWTSGRLWIWASMALLVGVVVAMYAIQTPYFSDLRRAVGQRPPQDARKDLPVPAEADAETLDRLLASSRPMVGAAVGFGGIAIILWLMLFKPF